MAKNNKVISSVNNIYLVMFFICSKFIVLSNGQKRKLEKWGGKISRIYMYV